jgi:hypothetical protein
MAYDVHIVRTNDWLDAGSDPIKKTDVDLIVEADPELTWSTADFVDMADDSGAVTRYFMIRWRGDPDFWWYRDQVLCSSPTEAHLVKLVQIARALKARVLGDDGESYDLKKGLFGGEELVTTPPAA